MNIYIVSGNGEGKTELSAFDNALFKLGVHNYNYIVLSSVIPPGSKVIEIDKYSAEGGQWGHKLYAVKAEARSSKPGEFIGAAVGWYQADDGRGVFVEHEVHGTSESEVKAKLERMVKDTTTDICAFRGLPCTDADVKFKMSIALVSDKAACALVIAVFKAEGWE